MKKKNKEEKNLLHTEYGILKNSVYILGKIRQYKPFLPWLMLLGVSQALLCSISGPL